MSLYKMFDMVPTCDDYELITTYNKVFQSYALVANYSEDRECVRLAKVKMEKIENEKKALELSPIDEKSQIQSSLELDIMRIKLDLSSCSSYSDILDGQVLDKIKNLPNCGEKYFFLANLELAKDTTIDGFKEAVTHLNKALTLRPHNQAYLGLLAIIDAQLEAYGIERTKDYDQAEEDRQVQERRSAETLRKNRR